MKGVGIAIPCLMALLMGPTLMAQGPASVDTLLLNLHSDDPAVRGAATASLNGLKEPAALPALLAAWDASGKDTMVHSQLIQTLGNYEDAPAIGALTDVMKNAVEREARTAAAVLLRTERGRRVLIEALNSPNEVLRTRAISAFGGADTALIAGELFPLLERPASYVQAVAVITALEWSLESRDDTDSDDHPVLPQILAKSADSSVWVRAAVADAVKLLANAEHGGSRFPPNFNLERAIPVLTRLLTDRSVTVRLATVDALAAMRGPEALAVLRAHPQDPNVTVRTRVRRAVASIGPPSVPSTPPGLRSGDASVRLRAIAATKDTDLKAVPALIALLAHDSSVAVRTAAAERLGEMEYREHPQYPDSDKKDLGQAAALSAALRDPETAVALKSAKALQQLNVEAGMGALVTAVADSRRDVSLAAINALWEATFNHSDFNPANMSDADHDAATKALLPMLESRDAEIRRAALRALPGIVPRNRGPLLLAAFNRSTDPEVRNGLLKNMGYVVARHDAENEAFEADAAGLAAQAIGEPATVEGALGVLYELRAPPKAVADRLIEILSSRTSAGPIDLTIFQSMEVLDKLHELRAVPALIGVMKSAKDSNDAKNAAIVLGHLKDDRAIDPLLDALRAPDEDLREHAARALSSFTDTRIVPALTHSLTDERAAVRLAAVDALGLTHAAAALDPLSALLRDSQSTMRTEAARALGELGDRRATAVLNDTLHAATSSTPGNTFLAAACRDALKKLGVQ